MAPDSVEPGKAVDISVKAKPNSYVGVLGVDQSVLLLRKGNDITRVRFPFLLLFSRFQGSKTFKFSFYRKMCWKKSSRTTRLAVRITRRGIRNSVDVPLSIGGLPPRRLEKSSA